MGGKKRKFIAIFPAALLTVVVIVTASVSISAKGNTAKDIEWVKVTPHKASNEVAENSIENSAYIEEPVFLARSSNILDDTDNEIQSITLNGVSEDSLYSIDGNQIYINPDAYSEEEILTVTADELVKWAFRAYYEGWEYVYGGCEEGHVDCSGLIKSRVEVCARGTEELLAQSAVSGPIETIPDIPGLGVYMFGHVGIYVGDGMVIDARTETSGVGYDTIDYEGWTNWFEIKGVDYSRYLNDGNE